MFLKQPYSTNPDLSDPSLKGAWLNPLTKGTANDASSSGNNGTTSGGVKFLRDGGVYLNKGPYIDFSTDLNFDESSNKTIVVTFKTSNTQTTGGNSFSNTIIADVDGGPLSIGFGIDNSVLKFSYFNGSWNTISGTTNFADGAWHRLVGIIRNGNIEFYVDNKREIGPTAFTVSSGDLSTIGAWTATRADISIKDVEYYHEAKSESWVKWDYQRRVPDDSLVLWLPYGDADYSRYNRSITNTNTRVGRSMEFNGSNSILETPVLNQLSINKNYTISFWINLNSLSQQTLLDNAISGSDLIAITLQSNGKLTLGNYNGTSYFSKKSINLNSSNWTYITYSFDGSTALGYKNGLINADSIGDNPSSNGSTTNIAIGARRNNSVNFNGQIKDLRIYEEVKSASFIKNLYETTKNFV